MVFIPSITLIFIVLNASLIAVRMDDPDNPWRHVLVVLDQLVFLTPVVNHFFFTRFATKLEELSELRIVHCRWMLCCAKPLRNRYAHDELMLESEVDSAERRF